jgi:hypothetical protein
MIYYYLTVFPMEALIASELDPQAFSSYMATGSRKGAAEQLVFIEIEGSFDGPFDWDFAKSKCVPHSNGEPKHSLYLSIYRVLEHIPHTAMKSMYLVTKDGRSLQLYKSKSKVPGNWKGYAMYQELCPVSPLVASSLNPQQFGEYMISDEDKVTVPALVFADVRVIDLDDFENSGNVGSMYDRNLEHMKNCIDAVKSEETRKVTKTVDRSFSSNFSYQIIDTGIYAAAKSGVVIFSMPTYEELRQNHYDWGRSANIF